MVPGSLANAFQHLFPEVSNKAIAFVGYGYLGATRAITNFRVPLSILKLAIIQKELNLSLNRTLKILIQKMLSSTPVLGIKMILKY